MKTLKNLIEELPEDCRQEVMNFIESLLQKRVKKPGRIPKLTWAGVLEDLKDQYTSVELQHKISEWRIGEK